ncbi:shikimate kinase-domain-containing protein [Baffinella frigidus]|nr:shikimate kinase-domain-containing protein [Cryptophyta sp. CCMP2293]
MCSPGVASSVRPLCGPLCAGGVARMPIARSSGRRGNALSLRMGDDGTDVFSTLKESLKRSSIFLIGMDGSGKEALALGLAKKLEYKFLDTNAILGQLLDSEVSAETFAKVGEEEFMAAERAVLDEVQAYLDSVISTGSCAPLQAENWAKFRTGLVAYVKVTAGSLDATGLQAPLASEAAAVLDVDATSRLGLILAQRKGRYEEADVVFDPAAYPTEEERVKGLAQAFLDLILENPPPKPKLAEAHVQALSRIFEVPEPGEEELLADQMPATSDQVPREQIQSLNKMLKDSLDDESEK